MTQKSNKPLVAGGIASAVAAIVMTVLSIEGGYVNNPRDPGGATNHGITEAVARQHGYTGHMRDLSKEQAINIYARDYVEKPGFLPLIERSPALGEKVVDIGVNAGTRRAGCWLQEALNDLSRKGRDYPMLTVDCRVGPGTLAAYDALVRKRGRVKACELTIKLLDSRQAQHYRSLPTKDEFLIGWVDHRIGNVPVSRCGERIE